MHDLALAAYATPLLDADVYRLRRAARDLHARSVRGPVFYVAASFVFMLTSAADWLLGPDRLATFARIDRACHEAKKQGRSRLVQA